MNGNPQIEGICCVGTGDSPEHRDYAGVSLGDHLGVEAVVGRRERLGFKGRGLVRV
jgi:hypothetical protein